MSKSHYIIPIFVPHEGCPHNCVFCNQNSITGIKESDKPSAEKTRKIVNEYLKTFKVKDAVVELSFYGGTFTAIPIEKQNELLEVAYEFKKAGKIDYIHMSTRPDYIDDFILSNLKKYSVDVIELGVQSMDDEVLVKSGRGHTADDVIKASKLIKEYGFVLGIQLMLGLPGDNFKKDVYSCQETIKLKPEIARIYPSLVIKNTPMEKMFYDKVYKPYSLDEAVSVCKVVYSMLTANNINVIRVGLQPTEEINVGKELVAGPFHPAFRELVEGSMYNDMIVNSLKKNNFEECTISVNPLDISKIYTCKKLYYKRTLDAFKTASIKIVQNKDIPRGNAVADTEKHSINMNFNDYVSKYYLELI